MIHPLTSALPSVSLTATVPASSGLAGFLLRRLNDLLGLMGLLVLGYGVVLVLRSLYQHYRGESIAAYHTQWLTPAHHDAMPPLVGVLATAGIGLLVAGIAVTGGWVALVNGLMHWGHHVGQAVQNTVMTGG